MARGFVEVSVRDLESQVEGGTVLLTATISGRPEITRWTLSVVHGRDESRAIAIDTDSGEVVWRLDDCSDINVAAGSAVTALRRETTH